MYIVYMVKGSIPTEAKILLRVKAWAVSEFQPESVRTEFLNEIPLYSRKTTIHIIDMVKGSIPSEARIFA